MQLISNKLLKFATSCNVMSCKQALALKPDHQFCGEMLNIALDDAINFK